MSIRADIAATALGYMFAGFVGVTLVSSSRPADRQPLPGEVSRPEEPRAVKPRIIRAHWVPLESAQAADVRFKGMIEVESVRRAIFVTAEGETVMVGVGEKIANGVVRDIGGDSVTLDVRGPDGDTYRRVLTR